MPASRLRCSELTYFKATTGTLSSAKESTAIDHFSSHELRVVAAGRKVPERHLLGSVMSDLFETDSPSRRLAPAANGSLNLVSPSLDGKVTPAPTDESRNMRQT